MWPKKPIISKDRQANLSWQRVQFSTEENVSLVPVVEELLSYLFSLALGTRLCWWERRASLKLQEKAGISFQKTVFVIESLNNKIKCK